MKNLHLFVLAFLIFAGCAKIDTDGLRSQGRKYAKRGAANRSRGIIKERKGIEERPQIVNENNRPRKSLGYLTPLEYFKKMFNFTSDGAVALSN